MGAMQKVMQKLQAKSHENGEGTAASPGAGTSVSAQETAAAATSPDANPSGFVPDPSATPQSTGEVSDDGTNNWDMNKLDQALVAFHDRYSAVSEQYRSLRARLLNMNPQNAHQVIAITSSLPQEGKSVTTLNLGMVMAEGNERQVLIADADFRRASIARMLGIDAQPGLAELIRGAAQLLDVLRPTPLPNLKVITAGATGDKKYGELIGASATRAILAQLRERFDYTFLDTPPVNTVSDLSMLAPHCDGAMLMIEMRRTSEPTVQEAVRTLQTTNVKILGCILSRYDNQRSHYYERYYSYYYRDD
ncbi:MAG: CpsD/CapB family tyrosine-protein kinase [Phycisphaerae bacterium]